MIMTEIHDDDNDDDTNSKQDKPSESETHTYPFYNPATLAFDLSTPGCLKGIKVIKYCDHSFNTF